MNKRTILVLLTLVSLTIFTSFSIAQAKTSSSINFKDKNLETALSKFYKCNAPITKQQAHELSEKEPYINISASNISDLEGIQYFDNLLYITMSGNKLSNIKPLCKLTELKGFDISDNSIKGIKLEKMLNSLDKIDKLNAFTCNNNEIKDISFLNKIGDISSYYSISLSNNEIMDISILKDLKKLRHLDLVNNKINDITPLQDVDLYGIKLYIHDNCIIDLKPIKPLFDEMFSYGEYAMKRYDFYINPIEIIFHTNEIQFSNINVYYKYQVYAEAIPLIKSLGGSAEYNKEKGILSFKIGENEYRMKDFSKIYTINGKDKSLNYEMRRMQYDLPYVPVKDICKIFGLKYNIKSYRYFLSDDNSEKFKAPKTVVISKYERTCFSNGFLYKIIDNSIEIMKYYGTDTEVIIPSRFEGVPVTSIAEGAFKGNKELLSVELPNTIQKIGSSWGKGAFSNCKKLKSVKLNEGKEAAFIGAFTFENCKKLTEIIIPENYKIIGVKAFSNCTSLSSVRFSEGLKRISAGAFENNKSLTSVSIPSTIEGIGYNYGDNYSFDNEDILYTGAFERCTNLSEVTIAEGKADSFIGTNTFSDCTKLENIIIPGNYKKIHDNAFRNCSQLKSMIYEKSKLYHNAYQTIAGMAFWGCINLEIVSLSETLKYIESYAFWDCIRLKEIVIPEGTTWIGNGAFLNNTSLERVIIPSTIKTIGTTYVDDRNNHGSSFERCTSLVSVIIKAGTQDATMSKSTFKGCSKLEAITIPANYTTIGDEAFSDCIALKSVIYQQSNDKNAKQRVMYNAFENCKSLTAVSLPSTLTYLDDYAFKGCSNLETVSIPTGVNPLHINEFIFSGCSLLKDVYIGQNVICNKYTFSQTNSEMKLYTLNKSVKKIAIADKIEVAVPPSDFTEGMSLFGSVKIDGTPEVGNSLIANIKAVVPICASVSYEWRIDGMVVGKEKTYLIESNDNGKEVTLTVTGTNGYLGSLSQSIIIKSKEKE